MNDTTTNKIVHVSGSLSNRKTNDDSLLQSDNFEDINKTIYSKINHDGKLTKSISALLEERWLICINCDISIFNNMQSVSELFLANVSSNKPESLFKNDWQDKLNLAVHKYLQEHNLSYNQLKISDKKHLIEYLYKIGAFNEKNAADYVAKTLELGRATIFKHLKTLR